MLQRQACPVHLEHLPGGVNDPLQGREQAPGIGQGPGHRTKAVGKAVPVSRPVILLSHR